MFSGLSSTNQPYSTFNKFASNPENNGAMVGGDSFKLPMDDNRKL
jgi:hypothetical protein